MRTTLLLVVACVFAGCSPVRSVRAVRQHGREPASAAAVVARAEDLRESLALLDRLLAGPGYGGPGTLAKQLALGETEADGLIKELESTGIYRNAALRVPVVTLYRRHLDEVLTQAAGGSSLLAAVEARFGADSGLVAAWQGLTQARATLAEGRRAWARLDEQRDALAADDKAGRERLAQAMEAQDQENDRVAGTIEASRSAVTSAFGTLKFDLTDAEARALMDDLIAALSFGGRMAAEGAALVQVVLSQTYGALRDFKKRPGQAAEDLLTVVLTLRSLDGDLAIATEVLSDLAALAAQVADVDLDETAGYLYENTASDLIGGLALDSFYFDLRAGGEVLFFHNAQRDGETEESAESNITYDLTGQRFRLEYEVQPIVFATVSLSLGLDLLRIPGLVQLDFGYKTDRVYQSGGTIERSDNALGALGASGTASDVLALGLAVLGVRAAVERATFNAGSVQLRDVQLDSIVDEAPFTFTRNRVALTYDLLWVIQSARLSSILDALDVGFLYTQYTLPRILYQFEDRNGDPEQDDYFLVGESDPQDVESRYYQGGVVARGAWRTGTVSFPLSLGFYVGGGPADFDFPGAEADALLAIVVPAHVGIAYSFAEPRNRLHIDAELIYSGELIYAASNTLTASEDESDLGDRSVDFGGIDVFHGPSARLRVTF